mgnify:CR=1 FL=1
MDILEQSQKLIDNPALMMLIVIWMLGGQLFSDVKASRNKEELSFVDKTYFTIMWPIIVGFVMVKHSL